MLPHRTIRGFTTFAVPGEDAIVSLADQADGLLIAVNAEKLARADQVLRRIVNANVGYPDGMGAVLALRRLGLRSDRVAGADLWVRLVREYATTRRFHLIGSTPEVIQAVASKLRADYPGIDLRFRDGYLDPEQVDRLTEEFTTTRPEVVLVGMGSPRQEVLMERLFKAHPALYMGLGGSFDVYVGRKPRAPLVVQTVGLEWAYQFVRAPRRLHRLPAYLKFAMLLALGRLE